MRATSASLADSGSAGRMGITRALTLGRPSRPGVSDSACTWATRSVSCCMPGSLHFFLEIRMLETAGPRRAHTRDAAECRADAHAHAGRVALAQHVAGHHLA